MRIYKRAIEVTAFIDEFGDLRLDDPLPDDIGTGQVKVILIPEDELEIDTDVGTTIDQDTLDAVIQHARNIELIDEVWLTKFAKDEAIALILSISDPESGTSDPFIPARIANRVRLKSFEVERQMKDLLSNPDFHIFVYSKSSRVTWWSSQRGEPMLLWKREELDGELWLYE